MRSKYQAVAVKTFQYCLKSLTFLILYQETVARTQAAGFCDVTGFLTFELVLLAEIQYSIKNEIRHYL